MRDDGACVPAQPPGTPVRVERSDAQRRVVETSALTGAPVRVERSDAQRRVVETSALPMEGTAPSHVSPRPGSASAAFVGTADVSTTPRWGYARREWGESSAPSHASPRSGSWGTSWAVALCALTVLSACRDSAAPARTLLEVAPDRGPQDAEVEITIRGENLSPRLLTDFKDRSQSKVDARYSARLGTSALKDVQLGPDGTLTARVPSRLPLGIHTLTVVDPEGRELVLEGAYRVLASTELDALVTAFRISPIDPQLAFAPFDVTIEAVDAAGSVVTTFTGAVTLTDLTGTAVPGVAGSFLSGRWRGRVEVRTPLVDDVLTAISESRTGVSNPFTVSPRPAVGLAFVSAPRTASAGTCSEPVELSLADEYGAPSLTPSPLTVTLTSSQNVGFALFSDPACTTAASTLDLAAGQGSARLYFRGTRAGGVTLTAAAPALAQATQAQTVSPAAADRLAFTSAPQVLNAASCSAPLDVTLQDPFGNAAPATSATGVDFAATPSAGFRFFSDALCTVEVTFAPVAAGVSSVRVYASGTVATVVQLLAGSGGLMSTTQELRINPEGFATRLAFVTPERSAPAGGCSELLTVQTQDSFGNAVAGVGAVQVSLAAAPSAGFTFFTDDACTLAAATVTITAGNSNRTFYFVGTTAGSVTLTASSPGLTPVSQVAQVTSGTPSRLAFSTPPRTVTANGCSAALTVQLQDALGNPAVDVTARTVDFLAAPAPGVAFFSDAACAVPAGAVGLPAGAGSASVYLRATSAGMVTVTAQSTGLTDAVQVENITAAVPSRLAIASAAQTVAAGACSAPFVLEVRDASGNLTTVPAATSAALAAAPPAGFAFYSDAACATAITAAPLPAGASSATVFFRGTAAGPVTLTATTAGLTPASQAQTLTPAAPDRFAFTTPARSVVAGACSQVLGFQTRDAFNNPSAPALALPVGLAAAPAAGVTFYSDAACTAAITDVTVAAGAQTGSFYFRATSSGAVTVTLSAASFTPASQAQTVTAAPPDRIAFLTAAQSVTVGACSSGVTLQSRDASGNASAVAGATAIALTAAPAAGLTFYSNATCTTALTSVTLAAASSSVGFYFRSTAPGAVTLTATPAGLLPASQGQAVTPAAAPSQLAFTTAAPSLAAGNCSGAVTVQTRDSFNNPQNVAAATTVSLAAAPAAGFAFYSDAACTAAITSVVVASGTSTASFRVRGTAAGTVAITASSAGLTPANQNVVITPASVAALVFTSAAKTVASGACSGALTLQSRDAFGNPSNVAAATPAALTASPAAGVTFYSDAACTTVVTSVTFAAGTQGASFAFRATAAGALGVTATAAGLTPASQTQTLTSAGPTQLAFTTPARTVVAGVCSALLTVQTRDGASNPSNVSAATSVALAAAPAAGVTFFTNATCTTAGTAISIPAGSNTASFYVRATAAGAKTLTASSAGLTAATQGLTVNAAAPDRLAVTTPARTELAGACSALVTVETRDPFGNPSNVPAALTLSITPAPAAGVSFFTAAAGCGAALGTPTVASGTSQLTFRFRATAVGTLTLTFAAAGYTGTSQVETISPAATSVFTWDAIPSPQALGFAFPVTVRARDAYGNPTPAFTGTATLTLAPAGTVACTTSCTSTTVTAAFTAGVWTGSVTVQTVSGLSRQLTATSGALTGTSNAFDVDGPPARSPPVSRHTYSPPMLTVGGSVTFDASPSTDWQTPTANLQVSWDFTGTNGAAPPWSPWTTTKVASNVFGPTGNSPNIYKVRLAVRDTDGDIGYGSGYVVSLSAGTALCRVDTSSDVDDGASSCTGPFGTDGRLSFREAIRLANAGASFDFITFTGPMTLSGAGTLTLNSPMAIVASPGVILDTRSLDIASNTGFFPVYLVGLEFTGQTAPITVRANQSLVMENTFLHDMAGLLVRGRAQLQRVRMQACTNHCVRMDDPTATGLQVSYSDFRASAPNDGILLNQCDNGSTVLDVYSSVFATLGNGIRSLCNGRVQVRNDTFYANATGLSLSAGTNHVVRNNLFARQTTSAATCGTATFTSRDYHLLYANAASGCVGADPNGLAVDPQFVFEAGADYRLRQSSPARDTAVDLGLDVNDAAPGNFTGAGVDRGGRETW